MNDKKAQIKVKVVETQTVSAENCVSFWLALLLLIAPSYAFADSGEHGGGFTELIPYWINFALYVAIMYFLTRKLIVKAWTERRQRIIENISSARAQFAQAEAQLSEAQTKWGRLTQEETRVRDEVARQGNFERVQLLENAKAKAERIVAQAKEHGQAERRSAEREVREEIVDDVLARAMTILKDAASPEADRGFRSSAVGAAGRLMN